MVWHVEFDQPIAEVDEWERRRKRDGKIIGSKQYLRLTFNLPDESLVKHEDQQCRLLQYKVGVSCTKAEYARLNLESEIPDWNLVTL